MANDMARFLGVWNCPQSRSAMKSATSCRSSARLVVWSDMEQATGVRDQEQGSKGRNKIVEAGKRQLAGRVDVVMESLAVAFGQMNHHFENQQVGAGHHMPRTTVAKT